MNSILRYFYIIVFKIRSNNSKTMKIFIFPALIVLISLATSCNNNIEKQDKDSQAVTGAAISGPDAIIYQTKAYYNDRVPVILNKEKTKIISYPAPQDLKYKGKVATPTELANGFLLDNSGITEDVAFLKFTYEEYMALEKTPSSEELMGFIIDYDPLVTMYNCGKRQLYQDEVKELNLYIAEDDLSKLKQLK